MQTPAIGEDAGRLRLDFALRNSEVKATAAASLEELGTVCSALAHMEVTFEGNLAGGMASDADIIALTRKGLLLRMAGDLTAMSRLAPEPELARTAAGIGRSVYEAACWIDLVSDGEHGIKGALLYRYHHERLLSERGQPFREHLARLLDEAVAACRDVEPLGPRIARAALRQERTELEADLSRLRSAWFGSQSSTTKGKPALPFARPQTAAGAAKHVAGSERDSLWGFWGTMLYEPTCRIVHVADAFDLVEDVTGAPRDGLALGHDAGDVHVVLAAVVTRVSITLTEIAHLIVHNRISPHEDDTGAEDVDGELVNEFLRSCGYPAELVRRQAARPEN